MPRALPTLTTPAGRYRSGLCSAWLLVRWVLLLALLFDQASAPFHHHHHEGVAAQFELADAPDLADDDQARVGDHDHGAGSHSALAIRSDPSQMGQLPAVDHDAVAIVPGYAQRAFAALDAPAPVHWKPDRSTSDFRSYRALPPAGRAPPLHT